MTMDNCEVEVSDESKINLETEGGSVLQLGKHVGKLLLVLKLAGLPVTEGKNEKRRGCLDILMKVCFPVFLLFSCLYLLYARLSRRVLSYGIVIDTILPILPCVMWIMMRRRNTSLNSFFVDLNRVTSGDFKTDFSFTTNVAFICFIFFYPLLLLGLRFYIGNDVNVVEVFRILQESMFPNMMAIVYIVLCYLILKKLLFCKKMFLDELDLASPSTAVPMMKHYLNVTKCIESFENLFSNISFVILLHDLLIVTILVIDMFVDGNFMRLIFYEALTEILYVFFSLLLMAVCAGNISIEIAAVKSVLCQKMFTQLDQDDMTNEKHVNLLLKKDVCNLTVGKALVFDRGFMLKVVIFILAEVVFIRSVLH